MASRIVFLVALVVVCGGSYVATAQALDEQEGPRPGRPRRELRAKIVERFDKNKDGALDDAERPAFRNEWRQRRHARILKKFDTDGDGSLSDAEKAVAKAAFIKLCDKDGDGKVSAEERRQVRRRHAHGRRRHKNRKPAANCPFSDANEN